jgi:hypothetical protein
LKNASVQQLLFTNRCPFLCHPERTRISYFTALTSATYVVLPKENHTQLIEAATLDRKSGGAEGSAVPRTFPGNAEYDAQEHCHLACSAPNDLGSGAGVLAQKIGVFVKKLVISRLQSSLLEMRILFEHRIPRFQESSAEPQIPRLRSG